MVAERRAAVAEREQLALTLDGAQATMHTQEQALEASRRDASELARLRNEIAQLRNDRDTAQRRSVTEAAPSIPARAAAATPNLKPVEVEWVDVPRAIQAIVETQLKGGSVQKITTIPNSVLAQMGATNRSWKVQIEQDGRMFELRFVTQDDIRDGGSRTKVMSWMPTSRARPVSAN
jgi:hypothetical protein